ncbi:hypothetical protein PR048_026725 [Dryococelus australis]|uniref:PiggyBac transposable element-derived protein domain-containing protein n=1 Tax=Dryococelus australis TaxID=614101 RepID=A0ABQ9GM54_9NEOP|nr:hypothetical protein PR048_026725 [Dryococelus australis]
MSNPVEHFFNQCKTPTYVFVVMIGDAVGDDTFRSNLYATQNEKIFNLEEGELLGFLGINFIMGYHKLPSWKHYWSTLEDLGVPVMINSMPSDRFVTILRHLHANNTSVPHRNKGKIYKLRPVVNKLNDRFQQVYKGTIEPSIYESVILFKGRSTLRQYSPMKPINHDYMLWAMADKKGYTLVFKVYQGRMSWQRPNSKAWGKEWSLNYQNMCGEVIENYILMIIFLRPRFLRDWQQKKHTPKNITDDKELDRGESDFRFTNTDVGYFKWKCDTKRVHLVSHFHGSEMTIVKRKDRSGNSNK